jgi:mono/diheme cytochrome c family protein
MKKNRIAFLILVVLNIVLISAAMQTKKSWDVPQAYKTKKNPVEASASNVEIGKTQWNTSCKPCHGNSGLGDGVWAKRLKKSCGNFSTEEFQTQLTDGGIYYLAFVKPNDSHRFAKKNDDETKLWNLVNYIRTLKK